MSGLAGKYVLQAAPNIGRSESWTLELQAPAGTAKRGRFKLGLGWGYRASEHQPSCSVRWGSDEWRGEWEPREGGADLVTHAPPPPPAPPPNAPAPPPSDHRDTSRVHAEGRFRLVPVPGEPGGALRLSWVAPRVAAALGEADPPPFDGERILQRVP